MENLRCVPARKGKHGVTILSLLPTLYINDLPNCLCHSQPRMYADDTSITFATNSVEEINECINSDLEEIRLWLAANKLDKNGIFINWI